MTTPNSATRDDAVASAATYLLASLEGRNAALTTSVKAVIDWTTEYLGAWWPIAQSKVDVAADRTVSAELDEERRREIAKEVARGGAPVETFIRTPGRSLDVGSTRYVDVASRGLAYEFDRDSGRLRIVGSDSEQLKLEASRFQRNLLTDLLERDGWVVLHAACVVTEGRGALILGDKGAGKTTSSLTLAAAWGGALLANDRCLVRVDRDEIQALPWPGSVSIGFGLLTALGWFDRLSDSLISGARQHPFQDPRAARMLAEKRPEVLFGEDGREIKAEIMPRDLTSLFGIPTVSAAVVDRVIFPRVVASGRIGFEPVDVDAAAFQHHILEGAASGYPDFLGMGSPQPAVERDGTARTLGHLADLPHFSLELGFDPGVNRSFLRDEQR